MHISETQTHRAHSIHSRSLSRRAGVHYRTLSALLCCRIYHDSPLKCRFQIKSNPPDAASSVFHEPREQTLLTSY